MRIGTQDKDFLPDNFIDKFLLLKEIGFECFEVDGRILLDRTDELINAVKMTGFPVASACGGARGWIGDFVEERRLNAIEDISQMIVALKKVGGHGIVIPAAWGMFSFRLPPMISPRSVEGDKKAIMASLDVLNTVAFENGLFIYLEPLNRYQDHMLNTLEDARKIIVEGNYCNVKILGDFYHMSIEEDDISRSLEYNRDLLGHIHIAENHRYQPGTGSINFARHFRTLKKIDYEGDIIYEGRVRGDSPLQAYKESIEYLKSML